jgi:anaerobic selenocysteine-containing dehydrogenase
MNNVETMLNNKIACEETGIEIKKSLCSICNPDGHCGINAYVKDGKIIKIEGNKDNIHSDGSLCAKGAANRQYVYDKDRILYPMKRIGEKGEGKFEKISWDEAYDIIGRRLNEYKKNYGGKSIAMFSGFSKWYRPVLSRLAKVLETPNYCTESSTCFRATQIAWKLVFGSGAAPDFNNSKLLVVWSKNPFHTQSYQSRYIMDARERGMKIIAIDPRTTPTTQIADIHLKLKPGTDGALALAMANVMINEGLYDKCFVEKYTYGFEEFKDYANDFNLGLAEKITGVKVEDIIKAARMYATIKPASLMVSASPVVHHVNGVQNYRAVMNLVGLTGNYNIKGGNITIPYGYLHSSSFVKTNEQEYQGERYDKEKGIGEEEFPVWFELVREEVQAMRLADYVLDKTPYEIKAVLGIGLNHMMWPDSNRMYESLKKLDFFVNIELFMTESCKCADVILPACSSLERSEIKVYNENFLFCSEKAIEPLGESKSDIEILLELAKKMNLDDEMLKMTYDEYMNYILEPSGVTLSELRSHKNGMMAKIIQPYNEKEYIKSGFKTPSGKMEFYSLVLEKYRNSHGYDPLPKFKSYKEIYPEYNDDEFPFILNTGSRKPQLIHTRTYRLNWIDKLENVDFIDIHPNDAKRLELKQNDIIKIVTPEGSISGVANITIAGQEGVVFTYHGNKNRDVNQLFNKDYLDPISGFPGFKSNICKIEKVADVMEGYDE